MDDTLPEEGEWLREVHARIGEPTEEKDPEKMILRALLRDAATNKRHWKSRNSFVDDLEEMLGMLIKQGHEKEALHIFSFLVNVNIITWRSAAHLAHFWKREIFQHPPFSVTKEYLPELGAELFRIVCISIPTAGELPEWFGEILTQLDTYYRETPEAHQEILGKILRDRMSIYRIGGYKAALMTLEPRCGLYMELMRGWVGYVSFSKMRALVSAYDEL